jgi:hypothetical protein
MGKIGKINAEARTSSPTPRERERARTAPKKGRGRRGAGQAVQADVECPAAAACSPDPPPCRSPGETFHARDYQTQPRAAADPLLPLPIAYAGSDQSTTPTPAPGRLLGARADAEPLARACSPTPDGPTCRGTADAAAAHSPFELPDPSFADSAGSGLRVISQPAGCIVERRAGWAFASPEALRARAWGGSMTSRARGGDARGPAGPDASDPSALQLPRDAVIIPHALALSPPTRSPGPSCPAGAGGWRRRLEFGSAGRRRGRGPRIFYACACAL